MEHTLLAEALPQPRDDLLGLRGAIAGGRTNIVRRRCARRKCQTASATTITAATRGHSQPAASI